MNRLLIVFAAGVLLPWSVAAERATGQFTEVFTVPPDSLLPLVVPDDEFDFLVGAGQQLNLVGDPEVFISDIFVTDGGELNYSLVGDLAAVPTVITVWNGATANLAGTAFGDFRVEDGGIGRVRDGDVGNTSVTNASALYVEGGLVDEIFADGSSVSVTGGA